MDYFECPHAENGKHTLEGSSYYYNHLGVDLGRPDTWQREGDDRVIPFVAISFCAQCENNLVTFNMAYPHSIRWDNREKAADPKAKGGWTLLEDFHQVTYLIEEEPTFGFLPTPTPAFLVTT